MSQSADSQGWEGLKNVMRTLYIAKGYPLEGAKGVIELMEIRRGFKVTNGAFGKNGEKKIGKSWARRLRLGKGLLKKLSETPPRTPPGFEIRTPIARPLFRLAFENLPILQSQENIQLLGGKQELIALES
ncbi:hypothetical protein BGZ57DRAFT_862461 [Hyaloscypha finlandica]|nr:hypothetical protein BGZ57DRAFT_862461 [Hyaloscypha finlandica]KAH8758506.1 hypothetical protein F5882DRAFT_384754 [Hyaloscypha sp. PMI_1271]